MSEFGPLWAPQSARVPFTFAEGSAYGSSATATFTGPAVGLIAVVTDCDWAGQTPGLGAVFSLLTGPSGNFVFAHDEQLPAGGGYAGWHWHGMLVIPHGSYCEAECITTTGGVYAGCSISGYLLPFTV